MRKILILFTVFFSFSSIVAQSEVIIIDGDEVKVTKVKGFNNSLFFYKDESGKKTRLKPSEYKTLEFQKGGKVYKYKTFKKQDVPGPFPAKYVPLRVLSEGVYNLYAFQVTFQTNQKSTGTLYYSEADDETLRFVKKDIIKKVTSGYKDNLFSFKGSNIKRVFDEYNLKYKEITDGDEETDFEVEE